MRGVSCIKLFNLQIRILCGIGRRNIKSKVSEPKECEHKTTSTVAKCTEVYGPEQITNGKLTFELS